MHFFAGIKIFFQSEIQSLCQKRKRKRKKSNSTSQMKENLMLFFSVFFYYRNDAKKKQNKTKSDLKRNENEKIITAIMIMPFLLCVISNTHTHEFRLNILK